MDPLSDPAAAIARKKAWIVRTAITAMGLTSLFAGLGLYVFAERIGIDPDAARLMITAFVLAAVADGLLVYFWDRLFGAR